MRKTALLLALVALAGCGADPALQVTTKQAETRPKQIEATVPDAPPQDALVDFQAGRYERAIVYASAVHYVRAVRTAAAVNEQKKEVYIRAAAEAVREELSSVPSSNGSTKPAVSAPSHSVPSGSVWDSLAACEAGGNWAISTGNGFYGGLQFTLSSWHAVGGSGYPHQASREEQIRRGIALQAAQGWGAWPACSAKLGLR